jgi:hypothetical protein
VHFV